MPEQSRNNLRIGSLGIFLICGLCGFLFTGFEFSMQSAVDTRPSVQLGCRNFCENFPSALRGRRLGLVINHTSTLEDGRTLLEVLLDGDRRVGAVFAPEHGFTGQVEGGRDVEDSRMDNIRIFSLYGKSRKPSAEQMKYIDAFVYDIQDVGTRFYTYITTMKYILEAGAEFEKPVYILDRPNPAGGLIVEGPQLEPAYTSFIGAVPIPVRYGLTAGELAWMMRGEGWVPANVDLHVIPMTGWKRRDYWEDTKLPWTATSPNIPTPETAVLYPGTGLLGALILNQGLGTELPFLQFGAPWLEPERLIAALGEGHGYGLGLEAADYTPVSIPGKVLRPPYENRSCRGVRIDIRHPDRLFSLRFVLDLIRELKMHYPDQLHPVENSLNLMFGTDGLSRYLDGSLSFDELTAAVTRDEQLFLKQRRKYLLYD